MNFNIVPTCSCRHTCPSGQLTNLDDGPSFCKLVFRWPLLWSSLHFPSSFWAVGKESGWLGTSWQWPASTTCKLQRASHCVSVRCAFCSPQHMCLSGHLTALEGAHFSCKLVSRCLLLCLSLHSPSICWGAARGCGWHGKFWPWPASIARKSHMFVLGIFCCQGLYTSATLCTVSHERFAVTDTAYVNLKNAVTADHPSKVWIAPTGCCKHGFMCAAVGTLCSRLHYNTQITRLYCLKWSTPESSSQVASTQDLLGLMVYHHGCILLGLNT